MLAFSKEVENILADKNIEDELFNYYQPLTLYCSTNDKSIYKLNDDLIIKSDVKCMIATPSRYLLSRCNS